MPLLVSASTDQPWWCSLVHIDHFKAEESWMRPGSIGKFWHQQQDWAALPSFPDGGRHPPEHRKPGWNPCFVHCLCHLDKDCWPKDDLPKCTWGLGSSERVIPKASGSDVHKCLWTHLGSALQNSPLGWNKSLMCMCIYIYLFSQRLNHSLYWHKSGTQLFSINMVQQICFLKAWNKLRRQLQIQSFSASLEASIVMVNGCESYKWQ